MSSSSLPQHVINLLKSTKYVHLATCKDNIPHVSLMNYTFLQNKEDTEDIIIITTPKCTTKYDYMKHNPNVSLLVHDWMSTQATVDEQGEGTNKRRNSLYEFLTNLNKCEISRISVMMYGIAEEILPLSNEYSFLKSLHLNNASLDENSIKNYIKDEDTALFAIKTKSYKITDTDDNIKEYK